jgi:hypothetical protein
MLHSSGVCHLITEAALMSWPDALRSVFRGGVELVEVSTRKLRFSPQQL